MLRLFSLLLCLALGAFAIRCGSARKSIDPSELGPLGPGQARIQGTIAAIDPELSTRPSDPCARFPCRAVVRIDSVFGYGSGFARPLSPGEEISVRFGFTTGPTEEVLPDLAEPYPGLESGDTFLADLHATAVPVPGPGGGASDFVIYGYAVR